MTFLEFITYCKLKGVVTSHRELHIPGQFVPGRHRYTIALKARGYSAIFEYQDDNGHITIIKSKCKDFKDGCAVVDIHYDIVAGILFEEL